MHFRSLANSAQDFASRLAPAKRLNSRAMWLLRSLQRTTHAGLLESTHAKPAQQTQQSHNFTFALQGNQGSRTKQREDHYTPEKIRMECVLEKPVAPATAGK
jgi:hypothetical protein